MVEEKRSGIERREFCYVAHLPERRTGSDRRTTGMGETRMKRRVLSLKRPFRHKRRDASELLKVAGSC
jgi:hypothetical protein